MGVNIKNIRTDANARIAQAFAEWSPSAAFALNGALTSDRKVDDQYKVLSVPWPRPTPAGGPIVHKASIITLNSTEEQQNTPFVLMIEADIPTDLQGRGKTTQLVKLLGPVPIKLSEERSLTLSANSVLQGVMLGHYGGQVFTNVSEKFHLHFARVNNGLIVIHQRGDPVVPEITNLLRSLGTGQELQHEVFLALLDRWIRLVGDMCVQVPRYLTNKVLSERLERGRFSEHGLSIATEIGAVLRSMYTGMGEISAQLALLKLPTALRDFKSQESQGHFENSLTQYIDMLDRWIPLVRDQDESLRRLIEEDIQLTQVKIESQQARFNIGLGTLSISAAVGAVIVQSGFTKIGTAIMLLGLGVTGLLASTSTKPWQGSRKS